MSENDENRLANALAVMCAEVARRGGTADGSIALCIVRGPSGRVRLCSTHDKSPVPHLLLTLGGLRQISDTLQCPTGAWERLQACVTNATDQAFELLVAAATGGAMDPDEIGRPWSDVE
jgi:hypothetical protein